MIFRSFIGCQYKQQLYIMNQQKLPTKVSKRTQKCLSARTFVKTALSKEKQSHTLQPAGREHLKTQHNDAVTYVLSKRQQTLYAKTSKQFKTKSSNVTSFIRAQQEWKDENLKLKSKLNELSGELTKQKTKNLQEMKSFNKIKKEMNLQFEEEKYLNINKKGNTNVMEGLKLQYKKIKKMYEEKCQECQNLMKMRQNSTSLEYMHYCEILENQNRKLTNRLKPYLAAEERVFDEYKKTCTEVQRDNHQTIEYNYTKGMLSVDEKIEHRKVIDDVLDANSFMIKVKQQLDQSLRINQKQKQKIDELEMVIRQKQKKIIFLDKLLIQKDNQVFQQLKKEKKMVRDCKQKDQSIKQIKVELQQNANMFKNNLIRIKDQQNKRFNIQKQVFESNLNEKDSQIEKLSIKNNYLSTLMSYIKISQGMNDNLSNKKQASMFSNFSPNNLDYLSNMDRQQLASEHEKLSSAMRTRQISKTKRERQYSRNRSIKPEQHQQSQINMLRISFQGAPAIEGYSESEGESEINIDEYREIKTSITKHSLAAIRKKPVKTKEVDIFKVNLMYRLMSEKIDEDMIKGYLDYTNKEGRQDKYEQKWKEKYVTMKEVREVLMIFPFQLREQQAILLSRYIVEDSSAEVIFYQQENQIERPIAKSILKAFIGTFKVPQQQDAKQELKQILSNYGKNLNSALSSLAPSGEISGRKLIQICEEIKIHISPNCEDWILSELFKKSQKDIDRLEYRWLFEGLL